MLAIIAFLSFTINPLNKKEVFLSQAIVEFLKVRHYEPLQINDELSERIFNIYLERMDFNKRYLLQADVDKFKKYQLEIDDQINQKKFEFFDLSSDLIHKRLLETNKYFEKLLNQPFDLTIEENIDTEPDNSSFAESKQELEEVWRKSLKLQVVARVAGQRGTSRAISMAGSRSQESNFG